MVITKRTKLSLCQLISVIYQSTTSILFETYEIYTDYFDLKSIRDCLLDASDSAIEKLINDIVSKKGYCRKNSATKYIFDELWADFEKCLMIDGYRVDQNKIVTIEPFIESSEPIEDDLTKELLRADLPSSERIISFIRNSAEEFRKPEPDYYNGCLTYSRVALETLCKELAVQKGFVAIENDTRV